MSQIIRRSIPSFNRIITGQNTMLLMILLLITLTIAGCAQSTPTPAPAKPTATPTAAPASAPAVKSAENTIELSLSSQFTSVSPQQKYLVQWAEKIKADSNGKLTVRIYPGATLTSAADIYPGVVKGVCDIATGYKYTYDKELGLALPVFMVGVPDSNVAVRIYNDIWNGFPEFKAEWTDVKVLWLSSGGPHVIHTTRKQVRTLEDVKGLQLRTSGKLQGESLVALGTSPVDISTGDLLSALQKGTVAGAVGPVDQLSAYKLADVCPYTINLSIYCSIVNFTAMNLNKYNSLAPDLQKVIDNSLDWGRQAGMEAWATNYLEGVKYANSKSHTFIDLAPDEEKRWLSVLWTQQEKAAADLDKKGIAGTKLLQYVKDRVKFYTGK